MQRPSFGIDKKKKESGFSSVVRSGVSLDPDAQAFLTATGIIEPTISEAINTLVVQMKADNIWTKMKAIYPMVGGSASTHKWNLKDPRDLDDAFRLTFSGGWTHSANGALPNGINAFANTFYAPATNGTNNDTHISIYSRTNSNGPFIDIGVNGTSGTNVLQIIPRWANVIYNSMYNYSSNAVNVANSDSTGLFALTRTSSTVLKAFRNGSQLGSTNTNSSSGYSSLTNSIYIGARNDSNSANAFSPNQQAFVSIGLGLTDQNITDSYNAVQAFQTTLNRQV